MKSMHELREMLCKELDKIAEMGELSAGSLEAVHKLTDTIKNIDKIEMLEDGGYSHAIDWMDGRVYDQDSSYARRGRHYVRGHYSRDDGEYSQRRRDSRGRYSRDGAKEHMVGQLEEIMEHAETEKEREAIRRCMTQLENA